MKYLTSVPRLSGLSLLGLSIALLSLSRNPSLCKATKYLDSRLNALPVIAATSLQVAVPSFCTVK